MTGQHSALRGKRVCVTAGALVTMALMTGCGPTTAQPDNSVRAHLDPVSGEIVMPMDEFAFYGRHSDSRTFAAAAQAVIGECMRSAGFTPITVSDSTDPALDLDDRTFGIWDENRAARYGWGSASDPLESAVEQAKSAFGTDWAAAYDGCNENNESVTRALDSVTPPQDEYLASAVSRLESEALSQAQKDERWQQAREPWETCLSAAGLTPVEGEDYMSQQSSALLDAGDAADTEEGIRLATIEARCNTESRLTQTLADIEASYQQSMIISNEALLNAEKERKQELLLAARDYINTHG
ncbi:MAG: hypothetical protein ACTJHU_01805 [Mycetocola sp.]